MEDRYTDETIILPTPIPSDPDDGACSAAPSSTAPNTASPNMPRPAASRSASPRGRKTGFVLRFPALIALCIACSIAGGAICLGSYTLLHRGGAGGSGNGTNGAALTGTPLAGSNLGAGATDGPSVDASANPGSAASGNVDIHVETVTSPATAVAKKVLPSIVGIRVTVRSTSSWYGDSISQSEGSGVIFSQDGYIITNYHVISGVLTNAGETNPNATLSVYLYTDAENALAATVVGYDIGADLAVIKVERTGLTPIEIGDSDALQVGDIAIAIGNPGGLEFMGSTSQGIISGLNRSIQSDSSYEDLKLIQTDAAINPGNSGGALVDVNGCLIGINSVKLVAEEYEGMGFAIPVNDVMAICTDLMQNGNRQTAYLGIELNEDYSAAYLERLGYPGGLLVASVAAGSPAEAAGIRADDILLAFDGTEVTTADALKEAKNRYQAGDTVTLRLYRLTSRTFTGRWNGEYLEIAVTLA